MASSTLKKGLLPLIPLHLRDETKNEIRHDNVTYKINMPSCGIGVDLMVRHAHEFMERIQDIGVPDEAGIVYFMLFRSTLRHGTREPWDEDG